MPCAATRRHQDQLPTAARSRIRRARDDCADSINFEMSLLHDPAPLRDFRLDELVEVSWRAADGVGILRRQPRFHIQHL